MLTFLSEKVPVVRNPTPSPAIRLQGHVYPETLAWSGFSENALKSRMIINSYTMNENPLKPLSISDTLSSFFRQ
jgi:hypothetical protein